MTRRVRINLVLVAALLLTAVGLVAAAAVYDERSRVAAECDERFGDDSPDGWRVRGIGSAVPGFDGAPCFVADYREERIGSRDPGVELRSRESWIKIDLGRSLPFRPRTVRGLQPPAASVLRRVSAGRPADRELRKSPIRSSRCSDRVGVACTCAPRVAPSGMPCQAFQHWCCSTESLTLGG